MYPPILAVAQKFGFAGETMAERAVSHLTPKIFPQSLGQLRRFLSVAYVVGGLLYRLKGLLKGTYRIL
jgi:hypothetical protein